MSTTNDFNPGDPCEVFCGNKYHQRWIPATFIEERDGLVFVEVRVSETLTETWSGTKNFLRFP